MLNTEKTVIAYLAQELGIPVYADVPETRPKTRFITVEQTGGTSTLYTQRCSVAIQVWAKTRFEASELAQRVHDIMPNMVVCDDVMHVETGVPYNFPLQDSPRYQIIAEVTTI